MIVLGVMAATDSLARGALAGRDPQMFYIIPLTDILIFAVPLYFAFRTRLDPPAHKRFIYIATIALLTPAIARLPFAFVYRKSPVVALLAESFLLVLVGYDLWSTRRIHRASTRPGVFRSCGHYFPPRCPDRPCPRGRDRHCRVNDQIGQ